MTTMIDVNYGTVLTARQIVWLRAWIAVANANDCHKMSTPRDWANDCLVAFDSAFLEFGERLSTKQEIWLTAWIAVANANDCKDSDVANSWANSCVHSFSSVRCGSVEEYDEIIKIIPDPNSVNFSVNLKGHGCLIFAKDLGYLDSIKTNLMSRPFLECH